MTLEEIIKRDGLNCGLCLHPVDVEAQYPHPLSATVGHIIPKDRGGDDEPSNVRVEHCSCNARKHTHLDEELELPFSPPDASLDPKIYALRARRLRRGARKGGINCPLEARIRGGKTTCRLMPKSVREKAGRRRIELHGPPSTPEGRRKGGITTGRMNVANGHLKRISLIAAKAGAPAKARHVRWHINRGIKNPDCKLCQEAA